MSVPSRQCILHDWDKGIIAFEVGDFTLDGILPQLVFSAIHRSTIGRRIASEVFGYTGENHAIDVRLKQVVWAKRLAVERRGSSQRFH